MSQGDHPSKNKELHLRPYFIPKLKMWYVGLICTTYLVLVFFLGVRPFSPSPLKTPLPMIGIWCVIIFAGTNFWLHNIHSLREPSLSPPEAPHKLLEYREKECLRALERKQKKTLERVESTIRGTWHFTSKFKTSESWSWNVILWGDTLSRLFRLSTVNDKVRKPKAPQE